MDRRKELKLQYKMNPPPMGIYQIRNTKNGKIYIGSSMNIPGKFNSARMQLNGGSHMSSQLQADWREFGESAFAFETLATLDPDKFPQEEWRKELATMLELWLEELQPYDDKGHHRIPKQKG